MGYKYGDINNGIIGCVQELLGTKAAKSNEMCQLNAAVQLLSYEELRSVFDNM